jgi:hypothetical protein
MLVRNGRCVRLSFFPPFSLSLLIFLCVSSHARRGILPIPLGLLVPLSFSAVHEEARCLRLVGALGYA